MVTPSTGEPWGSVCALIGMGRRQRCLTHTPEMPGFLKEKKAQDLGLPEGPYNKYRDALMASPAISSTIASGKTYVSYDEMSDTDIQLLLSSTDMLVHAVSNPRAPGS